MYTVELKGIYLLNPLKKISCMLTYPETAVWDLICRGEYSCETIISMLCNIASLNYQQSEKLTIKTLTYLIEKGFILKKS